MSVKRQVRRSGVRVSHVGYRYAAGGRVVVLDQERWDGPMPVTLALVKCDCGNVRVLVMAGVLNGDTKYCGRSCACLRREAPDIAVQLETRVHQLEAEVAALTADITALKAELAWWRRRTAFRQRRKEH